MRLRLLSEEEFTYAPVGAPSLQTLANRVKGDSTEKCTQRSLAL